MDIHFNAFISYRHHPDDIKVAMQVHRALERYHIPRGLKKKLNVRGPMRLFRDKEELPITSNLNDDIGDALRNSDYLIVICSVHTKESIWVQREIELFLQSHPRHRVLTVLASGEPYDVIPEILLYDDRVDPVTGETVREMVEPLSCDWRMGLKKAKREELPRLAAPLLGCAYDELRQRQRQYRMRRMITLFSLALAASLGFSGYVLRNSMIIQQKNVQIQANLEQAQRNQSRHLATAAWERLAEGDRLTAIALATAALPSENNVRPYVPEAENALTESMGIYQQNTKTVAVGTVSPGSQVTVTDFFVSPTGKMLVLRDDRKYITTWNAETLEKIGTWDLSEEVVQDLLILPDDNILLRVSGEDGSVLRCISPDGQLVWQMEKCHDVALTDNGATVLFMTSNDNFEDILLLLDPGTGEVLLEPIKLNVLSGFMTPSGFLMQQVPAGAPIPIRYSDFANYSLCLFQVGDRSFTELSVEAYFPDQTLFTPAGKLVLMTFAESDSFTGTFEGNRVNAPMRRQVLCYDPATGEQLWQVQVDSSMAGSGSLNMVPDSNLILCQSGPVFQVVDAATGETVNRCEAGSRVITVTMGEKYAQAVLEDGYLCNYWYYDNYCYEDRSLQGGLTAAYISTDYYSLQRESNHVTVYRRQDPPALWRYQHDTYVTVRDQRVHGKQWAIADINNLYLLDMDGQTMRWSLELPSVQLLDFNDDGTKLWAVATDGTRKLFTVDTATGKYTSERLADEEYVNLSYFTRDGYLYYTMDEENRIQGYCLDLQTGETTAYDVPLPADTEEIPNSRVAGQNGQYLWIWTVNGWLLEVDMTAGTSRVLAEEVEQCPVMAVAEDSGLVAATNGGQVLMITPGAEEMGTIQIPDARAGSVYFAQQALLVLCDDGYLYRYDVAGTLLSRTALEVGTNFDRLISDEATQAMVSWQLTRDGRLVVNACGAGNVIEQDTWKVTTVVPDYSLYREENNTFVCKNSSGFAGYPSYTVPELLELARKELKNFQLTDDQKLAYGID